jgi:hypothetical protein
MFRREIRDLILAFFLLSLGGLILHARIHPPLQSLFNWIPLFFTLVNALCLPFLFNRQDTVPYAYLFTWATVAAGTAGMAYFSIDNWNMPVTPANIVMKSTFPDILILWSKIFLAHKILRFHWPEGVVVKWERGCKE